MRKIVTVAISLLLLPACTGGYVGMAFHREGKIPEPNHNPLGVIHVYYDTDYGSRLFCEHISSIPDDDGGINMCGALWRLY